MSVVCPHCGIERETLETPCLICGFKPDHQPPVSHAGAARPGIGRKETTPALKAFTTLGTSHAQTSVLKRPITHVVWFTLVIVTLALAVTQCLGELVRAFFVANKDFVNRDFVIGLYCGGASMSAFAGYKLLPGKGHLTLFRAVLWRIYSGLMLNVVHWITFATITRGWYEISWLDSLFTFVIFYGGLGLLALCIWGTQKMKGRDIARVSIPEIQFGNHPSEKAKGWIARNRVPCAVTVAVIVVASMAFAFKPKDQVSTRTNLFAHKQPARLAFKEDRQLEEQLEEQLESIKNEFQEVKDALDDVQYSLSSLKMEVDDFSYNSENWRDNVRDVEDATRRIELDIDDLESAISDVDSEL